MKSKIPIIKKWSGMSLFLIMSLAAFYRFHFDVSVLIEQLRTNAPVISYTSGFFGLFGVGLGLLTAVMIMVLEIRYKGKTSPKVLDILGNFLFISVVSVIVIPLLVTFLIPSYLESNQYRYCDVPHYGAFYPPTVYTDSPKSCIELLEIECTKPGRILESCIYSGMVEYREFIRIE